MQRKRGELVPIGEASSGLDAGPLQAIREASPQARHHFTKADQVNLLVSASEADADLGFMARMMALCSLLLAIIGKRIFLDFRRPATGHANLVSGVGSAEMDRSSG